MEIAIVLMFLAYMLPTIIAFFRGHASRWGILIVNLVFGFTFIGWIWALIWSLSNKGGNQTVTVVNQINNRSG